MIGCHCHLLVLFFWGHKAQAPENVLMKGKVWDATCKKLNIVKWVGIRKYIIIYEPRIILSGIGSIFPGLSANLHVFSVATRHLRT